MVGKWSAFGLETAPGLTVGQVREATEAVLAVSDHVCPMAL
jgi:acyl CoA:acetate/3-ketoacid CoA transferase beta subunit